ncbi:MAG: DUF2868 domain-containing protein [Rhodocyclaceae bacterium]|nr:DUF2868 domain-containing protein [Rhodocyclaceae bacterium]
MTTSRFDAHWLAEAVRLREARAGRLDDSALLAGLQASPRDFDSRALARAGALAERLGWHQALVQWHGNGRLTGLLLAALATSGGAGLALAAVGDGGRPVNLVWALLGLLGMHGLSLLLWLGGNLVPAGGSGAALGRLWMRLLRRVPAARRIPELGEALARLLARDGLARWLFGMISHGLWALLLASALLALLTLFSLRRYGFVWETTILSPDTLALLVATVDGLPRLLGLGAPAIDTLSGVQADAARAAWANWLMHCVALYGVLPRLLLWAWCQRRWRAAGERLALDMALPDNLLLRRRLMPDHGSGHVADPAPAGIDHAQMPPAPRLEASAGGALVAVELGPDLPWPPDSGISLKMLERVESRDDRRRALQALAADPPSRLLVVFDARLSPDRGSYALLAQLASHATRTAAWLASDPAGGDGAHLEHWREGLAELGMSPSLILTDEAAAMLWLEHADE